MVSAHVVAEISGVLYRTYAIRDTTRHVNAVLSYRMEIIPVTSEIVRFAAELSRDYKILPYDGIHIATAREANCDMIISADKELDKQNIVKRVDPLDYKISHTKETSNTK